jgi:hypothetical protein
MLPAAAKSSFNYAVFTFAPDEKEVLRIPVGVALWSSQREWVDIRLLHSDERLTRFNSQEHHPYVALVEDKIRHWICKKQLPYGGSESCPYETGWWNLVKELLVHRVRLTEPRPIDCSDPDSEIEPLYEAVVASHRAQRERRTRVAGEIRKCLNGLGRKFRSSQALPGFGGRQVRVLRCYDGPSSIVIIEGVNLASNQAEQQSDAVVSKLLRLREGVKKKVEFLVGYLASPEGLNGEKALVEWIEHRADAKTFDLLRQRQQFRQTAGDMVADAAVPFNNS